MEQCCGTCKFHRTDDGGEWICVNDVSEYYTDYTEWGESCSDYEERE